MENKELIFLGANIKAQNILNVDEEYLNKPKQFDVKGLKHFMLFMGPLSSCFDLIVFALIWFVFKAHEVGVFQTTWFTYSIVSNWVIFNF